MKEKKSSGCCRCCSPTVTIILLVFVGIILIAVGGALIPAFKKLIHDKIREQTPVVNGSQAYSQWHHPTSPIVMNYYLFDILNADQEILNGVKPIVKQRGPYAYREVRYNYPVKWGDNGNSITYLENIAYYFDSELSCNNCSDDDMITTPNVAVMAIGNMAKQMGDFKRVAISTFFQLVDAKLFHKLPVKKIIWGYADPILEKLEEYHKEYPMLPIPDVNTFVALQNNASAGANATGTLTMLTGKNDVNKVQQILKWRGNSTLPYWRTKYGNMINGSDGTHFKPFSKKTDILRIFITEICRSLYLVFEKERTVDGIKLYQYTTDDMLFANRTVNPDNIAFCVPECYEAGILPIGQCLPMNPPIMISAPHFYQGDPSLWQSFEGLKPEMSKHATFLNIEPYTGITMEAYKRLQINLYFSPVALVKLLENVKDTKFPIFFVEEHARIGAADAAKFKKMVYKPILMTQIIQYLLIALGGFLILLAAIFGFTKKSTRPMQLVHNERIGEKEKLLADGDADGCNNYDAIS